MSSVTFSISVMLTGVVDMDVTEDHGKMVVVAESIYPHVAAFAPAHGSTEHAQEMAADRDVRAAAVLQLVQRLHTQLRDELEGKVEMLGAPPPEKGSAN